MFQTNFVAFIKIHILCLINFFNSTDSFEKFDENVYDMKHCRASQMEIYNRLGTGPVPQKGLQYLCGLMHGLPPAQHRKVTWPEVVHRYWRGTRHQYHASTEICTRSVLSLLRSRLLADTWSQDWDCIFTYFDTLITYIIVKIAD